MTRTHGIGLVAALLLVAGIALGVRQARRPTSATPAPMVAAPVDSADPGVVDQALRYAGLDSAVFKSRWIEEVRGLDLAGMPAGRREIFLRYANAERCTCGCGYTLAGCRQSDMSCEISGPHLVALFDSVRTGKITSARGIRSRPAG